MRWPKHPLLLVTACLVASAPDRALAHDYWLAPESFRVAPRESINVDLVVGDHYVVESSRAFERARTRSFSAHDRRRVIDLRGRVREGAVPVLQTLQDGPRRGQVLVVMERDWVDIELPDAKFGEYLEHEELGEAIELREREGHRAVERERYMRVVKTLVVVGRQRRRDDLHRRVLGLPIEIVLLDDPATLDVGERLGTRVLVSGVPLPGATLTAYVRDAAGRVTSRRMRANADGVALFPVERAGSWMIRTVHLERCANCNDADWTSRWASFSFAIEDGAKAKP